jgi:hypothetical protein
MEKDLLYPKKRFTAPETMGRILKFRFMNIRILLHSLARKGCPNYYSFMSFRGWEGGGVEAKCSKEF